MNDILLLKTILSVQTTVRLYHWNTKKYARHVASGALYSTLDSLFDRFIETLQGFTKSRLDYEKIKLKIYKLSEDDITLFLQNFRDTFSSMELPSSDLINQREEIISEVNKTIYLFSLE